MKQASRPAAAILAGVRAAMQRADLQAVVVHTQDAHSIEYVAPHNERRAFLCGFCGSAGTCVVTQSRALLWTDGRYWLEATASLDQGWELMKQALPGTPTVAEWLAKEHPRPQRVGCDPFTLSVSAWNTLATTVGLVPTEGNIVDAVWEATGTRPPLSDAPVFVLGDEFTGRSTRAKIDAFAASITGAGLDCAVLAELSEIAWLFNLRGRDIANSPVFYAYALVTATGTATLFVDPRKVPDAVRRALPTGVEIRPYAALASSLVPDAKVGICDSSTPFGVEQLVRAAGAEPKKCGNFVEAAKAIKNPTELAGFRAAHVRDGAALTHFLAWVTNAVRGGADGPGWAAAPDGGALDEVAAADRLEEFRRQYSGIALDTPTGRFLGLSFPTISGSGPNGAVIHYRPEKATCRRLSIDETYLVDSGGQYLDGTTDVTRTVHFGVPPKEVSEAYTLVLKGHIALNSVVFPSGVTGIRIDALARTHLWSVGLDYVHGTGHGVGHCLNVHEGPQSIGTRGLGAPLEAGMVVSNEPGYYKSGAFGIRIENLETIVPVETKYSREGFLGLDTLTMAPLCRQLIDASLLTAGEVAWVDRYHRRVAEALRPLLSHDALALSYLEEHTAPLVRVVADVDL